MLHITTESYVLSPLGATRLEIAMQLTGIYWQVDAFPVRTPEEWRAELYPWRSAPPTHLKVWWLDANGAILVDGAGAAVPPLPVPLRLRPAMPQNDIDMLCAEYEAEMDQRLFGPGANLEALITVAVGEEGESEFDDSSADTPVEDVLRGRIAELAQKAPPFNQALGMAFLASADNIQIPAGAVSLVAVPSGGGGWWEMDESAAPLDKNNGRKAIQITGHRVIASIEELRPAGTDPAPGDPSPIHLWGPDGFDGQATISDVTDLEDWLPGLQYRIGRFFDLPRVFLSFLRLHRSSLIEAFSSANITDLQAAQTVVTRSEKFLLALLRDGLGLGLRAGGDGTSLQQRVSKAAGVPIDLVENMDLPTWIQVMTDQTVDPKLFTSDRERIGYQKLVISPVPQDQSDHFDEWLRHLAGNTLWQTPIRLCRNAVNDFWDTLQDTQERGLWFDWQGTLPNTTVRGKLIDGKGGTSMDEGAVATPAAWLALFEAAETAAGGSPAAGEFLDLRNLLSPNDCSLLIEQIMFMARAEADFEPESFFGRLYSKDFQSSIIRTQWEASLQPPLSQLTPHTDTLIALKQELENTDARARELETVACLFEAGLFASATASLTLTEIAGNVRQQALSYVVQRRDGGLLASLAPDWRLPADPPERDLFAWSGANPPPDGFPTWQRFEDYLAGILTDKVIQDHLFPELEKKYDIPPPVRITVDLMSQGVDDLENPNLEIAGHLLFSRRADTLGAAVDRGLASWFSYNWAVPALVHTTYVPPVNPADEPQPANIAETLLASPLLTPAFIPESDGLRRPYLQITNEKLHLIGTHQHAENAGQEYIENPREPIDQREVQYRIDATAPARALWYGYRYEFAGAVMLNSGVLPRSLREADLWNQPRRVFPADTFTRTKEYHHLRRVPIGPVRLKFDDTHPIKPLPEALRPLAAELPEWRGQEKSGDHTLFVLDNNSGGYHQPKVEFAIHRPSTDFWNWFAWVRGEDPTECRTQSMLARELRNRAERTGDICCEPAVERKLLVEVEELFGQGTSPAASRAELFDYPDGPPTPGCPDAALDADVSIQVKIVRDGTVTTTSLALHHGRVVITIPPRRVVRVKLYSVVRYEHFDVNAATRRFYDWMANTLVQEKEASVGGVAVRFTHPVEIWVESPAEALPSTAASSRELYETLAAESLPDSTVLSVDRGMHQATLMLDQFSRLTVRHQVWHWNGRLDASDLLATAGESAIDQPNPVRGSTTVAMKWEAWAFADRPDFSALVHTDTLVTWLPAPGSDPRQKVFTDVRPDEHKALYYRFGLAAHSRYESLGGRHLGISLQAAIEVQDRDDRTAVPTPWYRHIRRCSRAERLPKPAVRFILPLTRSYADATGSSAAPLLVVLNDRWFSEAGLAEKLEIGIEVIRDPQDPGIAYLNGGYDPTLTGVAMNTIDAGLPGSQDTGAESDPKARKREFMAMDPQGPVGLTFDLAAATPLLRGCAFVMNLPDTLHLRKDQADEDPTTVELRKDLQAGMMMHVAVRRSIRQPLCIPIPDSPEATSLRRNRRTALTSEWTAPEWVQFLPSTDFLLPQKWRHDQECRGGIEIKFSASQWQAEAKLFPEFDRLFEERMERWLLVTERVRDIAGQPCERYVATLIQDAAGIWQIADPVAAPGHTVDLTSIKEGWLRVILVRKRKENGTLSGGGARASNESIWSQIFGDSAKRESIPQDSDFQAVEDDPDRAAPISTSRIAFRKAQA
jgi:hypothetical protein